MRLLIVPATIISLLVLGVGSAAAAKPSSGQPDFGPNVLIFDPSMSTSQIQAAVGAVGAQQVPTSSARSAMRSCSSPALTARRKTL